ncbi:hypothetical protein [uncultured Pigmentiphaga sp.]|jgi:hypothetical protein|uniref:hypothetical protein n=1 Tax=uncultured Pigmentiphaga sp. TaxID=340361 RepID=UPI0026388130|nr:hypothetical protein [uncultured Pigmentiphaga sp.]
MTALERPQRPHVNLTNYTIIGNTSFDAQQIASPTLLERATNAAIAVLAVITLNDIGMYIQCSGFHQRIESLGVLVGIPVDRDQ